MALCTVAPFAAITFVQLASFAEVPLVKVQLDSLSFSDFAYFFTLKRQQLILIGVMTGHRLVGDFVQHGSDILLKTISTVVLFLVLDREAV